MIDPVKFTYLNHHGKKEVRTIDPESLEFIKNPGFGYQPGWFLSGRCHEKNARRSFSLNRIIMNTQNIPNVFLLMRF
jgi:predicted DNA-binding transcriptional regulator YafY